MSGPAAPGPDPADHPLIADHLARLARRLPPDLVEELADGLLETYDHHLAGTHDPDRAAAAAVAEFGGPDLLVAAYERQAPGRRTARLLLATGPLVGGCWAAVLLTDSAWVTSIPLPLRVAAGAVLVTIVTALVLLARCRWRYRAINRSAAALAVGVLSVDTALLGTVAVSSTWTGALLYLAALASTARIALTAHSLRDLRGS